MGTPSQNGTSLARALVMTLFMLRRVRNCRSYYYYCHMGSHSDNNDIIVIIVTIRYCGQVCSLVPSLPPDTSERLQVIIFL